jgi:uncharacterized protein (TIGR02145 family)
MLSRFFAFLVIILFTSCAKEFRNPYDPATPPDIWMPKAFKLDTMGTNALRLSWNQDERHIDGFAIQKSTNGQLKEILLPLDSLRYTDTQAVDTSSDEVCPELSYKVMARAGNNRSLDIGTASGIRMPLSTPANAGTDILVTDTSTTVQLNAQAANAGERGQWSIVSGTGGSFSNLNAHNSNFTGTPCSDYVLRWTKTGCTETYDEVSVRFQKAITIADAGANQTYTDGTTQSTLNANNPGAGESGVWTIISGLGGVLENPSMPNTLFIGQSCTDYILRWTITGICSSSSDERNLLFRKANTQSNAGVNQTITNNVTLVTLAANTPEIGEIGTWTIVNGIGGTFSNVNSATSTFTGNACSVYSLRWTIQGLCSADFNDVDIAFSQSNTTANAGVDQTITSNFTQVTLAANSPSAGETGTWTIISGVGGSVSNVSSPTSTFTGNACTSYVLRWTIGACISSFNDVVISFQQAVSQANAGADQTITNSETQVTLAANAPTTGETGTWTIISGLGGSFSNVNSPSATFTGNACTSYLLRWTIGSCSSNYNDVAISFQQAVSQANAGSDQTIISNAPQVTLAANSVLSGQFGIWSIVSGTGGSFSSTNSPTAIFAGILGQSYVLKWTISTCNNTSNDLVTIAFSLSVEGSGVTDIDGNVYPTTIIGTQEWMSENLKTTHYCNGNLIPNIINETQWSGLATGAWCYYENLSSNNTIYGKLYNWYTVSDSRNLCPCGWHVPFENEWTILTEYLGGLPISGGKMKTTGTSLWLSPNTNASNISGFSGLPGGIRAVIYDAIGDAGFWWTSDQSNLYAAFLRALSSSSGSVSVSQSNKVNGYSVRCIKD